PDGTIYRIKPQTRCALEYTFIGRHEVGSSLAQGFDQYLRQCEFARMSDYFARPNTLEQACHHVGEWRHAFGGINENVRVQVESPRGFGTHAGPDHSSRSWFR